MVNNNQKLFLNGKSILFMKFYIRNSTEFFFNVTLLYVQFNFTTKFILF